MGLSEYPLKWISNFKGLSVRPSERYPCNYRLLEGGPFRLLKIDIDTKQPSSKIESDSHG